jgi:hypothetical protein
MADEDERPLGGEHAPDVRRRLAPRQLEDEIVALPTLGEVLVGVVDDVVCADRSDHVHVPRAAHAGHFGAEGLGNLHGERPNPSRRADDQDLVPRLDPSVIAQTLEDFYIYGDPLLAVADGRVIEAVDSIPDSPVGGRTWEEMAGNHVVLDIGDGRYVL